MNNLYTAIPNTIDEEQFEALLRGEQLRIERILSKGQTSPAEGWYDQEEHEWVLVLEGCGIIGFADGREVKLQKGDYLHIAVPALAVATSASAGSATRERRAEGLRGGNLAISMLVTGKNNRYTNSKAVKHLPDICFIASVVC